jgi:hypothetical protein
MNYKLVGVNQCLTSLNNISVLLMEKTEVPGIIHCPAQVLDKLFHLDFLPYAEIEFATFVMTCH